MTNRVCPRCNKSVGIIRVEEKDPKTKKVWIIEKCFKCHYNFEIWDAIGQEKENKRALETKKDAEKWDRRFGKPNGGWIV